MFRGLRILSLFFYPLVLEVDESVFFEALEKTRQSLMQWLHGLAEPLAEESAHLFDTTAAVTQLPGVTADAVKFDPVMRPLQSGQHEFLEQRVPKLGLEDMDGFIFGPFPVS